MNDFLQVESSDAEILHYHSVAELLRWESALFREFQHIDYATYKAQLANLLLRSVDTYPTNATNLQALAQFVEHRVPRIGVYAGSFNPFHRGHLNIVHKAEAMFDKVIISQGINPDKEAPQDLHSVSAIAHMQVEHFSGLLTNYVKLKSAHANVTLVRGLRNGDDLDYEVNQLRFMQGMMPDLKVTFIMCDNEFEHISSSALRNLEKIEAGLSAPYLP